MVQAPQTLDGWFALHDVRRIDWPSFDAWSPQQQRDAIAEAADLARRAEAEPKGSSALYTVLGHKGDFLQLHLRPTMDELFALEHRFDRSLLARVLTKATSYVSVAELSTYGAPVGEEARQNPYVLRRLEPPIPKMPFLCFYPMNKRRVEPDNWYRQPMEVRADLMKKHGEIGRKYQGKVVQMITGSTGLDDFEWGVTLYADDPLQFKKLIYEMRFDEASSRFAEFGPFYIGRRLEPGALGAHLLTHE